VHRPNDLLEADVRDQLAADTLLDSTRVMVSASHGRVMLSGSVPTYEDSQRRAAERAVGRVPGVRGITDKIELTAEPIPSDVVDRVAAALRRNAVVDDTTIEVSNVGQTIYLDGVTTSWFGKKAAEDAAWGAPGVAQVVDRVTIIPGAVGTGLEGGDRPSSVDVSVRPGERR